MQEISRQLTQTEVLITRAQSLRTKFADEKDRKQLSQGNNMINSMAHTFAHLSHWFQCIPLVLYTA